MTYVLIILLVLVFVILSQANISSMFYIEPDELEQVKEIVEKNKVPDEEQNDE